MLLSWHHFLIFAVFLHAMSPLTDVISSTVFTEVVATKISFLLKQKTVSITDSILLTK